MQIQKNVQITNTKTANFKALKSVKCEGLYKKFPNLGKDLIDSFQANPTAMKFCKEHDVKLVFFAAKSKLDSTKSSIHLFFDNPVKSRFQKFIDFIMGKKEEIKIQAWSNEFSLQESLKKSTQRLIEYITPSSKVFNPRKGVLDSHIHTQEEKFTTALAKKNQKKAELLRKKLEKKQLKSQQKANIEALNKSIKELIENSK